MTSNAFMRVAALLLLSACALPIARAAESQFGFVYTTDLLPQGQKELEQWATWRHDQLSGYFDDLLLRTALEYGLTDRLQTSLYLSYAWNQAYRNGPFEQTTPSETFSSDSPGPDVHYQATRFVGVSGEAIYRLLSPYTDPLGVALYTEPTLGPQFREIENKLILQKDYLDDRLIIAFNATYAPEFRLLHNEGSIGRSWSEETDVNAYLAVSFRFRPNWSGGFEFLNEREFNSFNFTNWTNSGYYVGPSIHFGGKSFFVTGVFLAQLPWAKVHGATVPGAVADGYDLDNDFERYRVRIKAGFYL